MGKVKVAINGYGTIGKRVADAVTLQDDMELVGVSKTRPNFEASVAVGKGYPLYVPEGNEGNFKKAGVQIAGTIPQMIEAADIVVDCTPGGIGEQNKPIYEKAGVKAIWQGGEDHELAGFSFNSEANYGEGYGKDFARVVSCNTTGLTRVIYALDQVYGVKKVRVALLRRATDPGDSKKGPINAIVPSPIKLPSHHGPDVKSIMPHINITSSGIKLSTTLMHMHSLNIELNKECSAEDVIKVFESRPRLMLIGSDVPSTAEIMELGKDLGHSRGDMQKNCIWRDSISIDDGELYMFQAIHQESDVIPENVDCIRAMMKLEKDGAKSIEKTNRLMGL